MYRRAEPGVFGIAPLPIGGPRMVTTVFQSQTPEARAAFTERGERSCIGPTCREPLFTRHPRGAAPRNSPSASAPVAMQMGGANASAIGPVAMPAQLVHLSPRTRQPERPHS